MNGYNISFLIEKYGDPILRHKIKGSYPSAQRMWNDVPTEFLVFFKEEDENSQIVVYCNFLDKDQWHPSDSMRWLIRELLSGLVEFNPIKQIQPTKWKWEDDLRI
jgi:hypothetical protein